MARGEARASPTGRRAGLSLAAAVLAALIGWGAGFGWFIHRVGQAAPPPPRADAIVVLTGGAGRVETALRLLADGSAARLLISGVGRSADLADLARRAGMDAPALAGRVTLGRAATSTHGNAMETAAWARANRVASLIVVTAGYHMPRALAELAHALPGVALHPVPVQPPAMRGALDRSTWRLLAEEYTKWLVALTGLSALVPADTGPAGNGPAELGAGVS